VLVSLPDQRRGGLELLFSNKRKHSISLPKHDNNGQLANLAFLLNFLCENLMKDQRKEMFILDDTVFVFLCSTLSCQER